MGVISNTIDIPFLKWAGGKRWLVDNYSELFNIRYNCYFEPFLGSGAVFFKLAPVKAILSDKNIELMETYKAIRDEYESVEKYLKRHARNHSKNYYYEIREQKPRSLAGKAARFIYLNRTCWNGLYRVNLKGKFNVPIGTKSSVILSTDNFKQISEKLINTELLIADFEEIINMAGKEDLVFIDPPTQLNTIIIHL